MSWKKPIILRQRFIPYEIVDISSDELLYRDEELLITRWKAIRPRNDFSSGVSYTFLKDGFKVGRFYSAEGEFLFWYCDIIEVKKDEELDQYTLVDLLIDIKVMPDGRVRLLDADELAAAAEQSLVTMEQVCSALRKMDHLLVTIYSGNFPPKICKEVKYW
jgi:predicted RNA-binding protein associated with RNAse of E/G family